MKRRAKTVAAVALALAMVSTGGIASAVPTDTWTFQCGEDGFSKEVALGVERRYLDTWPTEPRSGGGWLFGYNRMSWTPVYPQWLPINKYPSNSCTGPWTRSIWGAA